MLLSFQLQCCCRSSCTALVPTALLSFQLNGWTAAAVVPTQLLLLLQLHCWCSKSPNLLLSFQLPFCCSNSTADVTTPLQLHWCCSNSTALPIPLLAFSSSSTAVVLTPLLLFQLQEGKVKYDWRWQGKSNKFFGDHGEILCRYMRRTIIAGPWW